MHDLLVVGAGPYGLSIAAHAAGAGLRVRIFGRPMAAWRDHMPRGMYLKSEPWSSNLSDPAAVHTLAAYCADRGVAAEHGRPLPIDTFTRYGLWFAQQAVPPVEERTVTSVRPYLDHYQARTDDGEVIYTRTVALAVGVLPFTHLPEEVRELPAQYVSHSSDLRDPAAFRDLDVTVLGAGQAALETATLLAEEGARPRIVARSRALAWNTVPQPLDRPLVRRLRDPHCGLGTGWPSWVWSEAPWAVRALPAAARLRIADRALGPAGAWWLRDRCEDRVPVRLGRVLRSAALRGRRVGLELRTADGGRERIETDHVVAATGFTPDLDRLTLLNPATRAAIRKLGAGRAPKLGAGFESSLPGLYFAGLLAAPAFGPAMRFVHGATFTAERLVRDVRRHLAGPRAARLPRPAEPVKLLARQR
ncbi:lysine N(6)-hydroxylase/L-ornithine N(5)-oxygenase family protein [Streptomyces sp. XM4193]|uniref:NAD(P)-binding domain-containing protein n=1 Tax=Streptomyces sp. XM4193 TaxID=2929782 RepID=UPI001FF9F2BF|nr:NAD(P)-binding domain-containing protein [Streptomyces sp. XM4193]MCK1797967.1 lysine N(6)-hydroxylase/L-ornithine N(5)-oxygenase family protein [Streptomyces sp. XM4193]